MSYTIPALSPRASSCALYCAALSPMALLVKALTPSTKPRYSMSQPHWQPLSPITRHSFHTSPSSRRQPFTRIPPLSSRVRRTFSTTPSQRRTIPIHNVPSDRALIVEVSPRAAARLATIAKKDENDQLALRIQVESGGCHGFQYLMSLVTLPEDLASATPSQGEHDPYREGDIVFAFVEDSVEEGSLGEAEQKKTGPRIIMDEPSLDLLKGSKVDFTQELIGSQFKIIDNPLATSSCGCGTSFDIKLD